MGRILPAALPHGFIPGALDQYPNPNTRHIFPPLARRPKIWHFYTLVTPAVQALDMQLFVGVIDYAKQGTTCIPAAF
jgi:hypothetical protein